MKSALAVSGCVAALIAGRAAGQPAPAKPAAPPAAPAAAPPPTVPNTPVQNYPTEVRGKDLEKWIKEIDSPDPFVREQALQAVLLFGPSSRNALPAVTRQVKQLNDIGPLAHAIIDLAELVPLIPDPTPGSPLDPRVKDAVTALIGVMNSPEAVVRYRAATTLGYIGPVARAALPDLIKRVDDRMSWEIRKAVCFALGRVGRDEQGWPLPAALEALARGVEDRQSKGVRLEALQAVILLGPTQSGPTPILSSVLLKRLREEHDKPTQIWIRVAIMRLNPTEINDKNLNVIVKDIKSTDQELRLTAIQALALMGTAAKAKVMDLVEALSQATDPATIRELCNALARMGQFAEKAIPSLATLTSNQDDVIKTSSMAALQAIQKAIEEAKKPPVAPVKP
jgi:HEAT repeat protein